MGVSIEIRYSKSTFLNKVIDFGSNNNLIGGRKKCLCYVSIKGKLMSHYSYFTS